MLVNSNIIKHADYSGIPEALREFPDFLKGNKNRARLLTRLVEQKRALDAQNDLVLDALNFNKRAALKIHKDFCPGDKNRSHKLTRILKIKIDKNNAMLMAVAKLKLPVEVSASELNGWVKDTSRTLRRRANDPLPCRIHRYSVKIPFYEEMDTDCTWLVQPLRAVRPKNVSALLKDNTIFYPTNITSEKNGGKITHLLYEMCIDNNSIQFAQTFFLNWKNCVAKH